MTGDEEGNEDEDEEDSSHASGADSRIGVRADDPRGELSDGLRGADE